MKSYYKIIFNCWRANPTDLEKKKIEKDIIKGTDTLLSHDDGKFMFLIDSDVIMIDKNTDTIIVEDFVFDVNNTIILDRNIKTKDEKAKDKTLRELLKEEREVQKQTLKLLKD